MARSFDERTFDRRYIIHVIIPIIIGTLRADANAHGIANGIMHEPLRAGRIAEH